MLRGDLEFRRSDLDSFDGIGNEFEDKLMIRSSDDFAGFMYQSLETDFEVHDVIKNAFEDDFVMRCGCEEEVLMDEYNECSDFDCVEEFYYDIGDEFEVGNA